METRVERERERASELELSGTCAVESRTHHHMEWPEWLPKILSCCWLRRCKGNVGIASWSIYEHTCLPTRKSHDLHMIGLEDWAKPNTPAGLAGGCAGGSGGRQWMGELAVGCYAPRLWSLWWAFACFGRFHERGGVDDLSWVVRELVTGQGGFGYSPGTSLVVGVGRCVYAVFVALAALVVLADLGDVAVAFC